MKNDYLRQSPERRCKIPGRPALLAHHTHKKLPSALLTRYILRGSTFVYFSVYLQVILLSKSPATNGTHIGAFSSVQFGVLR